ncbi:GntR family transcriptional regulator, phosphonate transport system regulatory protein [Salinihabitans flavidus]|uniref:GntR family transcriptional regulator, phosphonate transport system regulatory protein n=1 Tax=Salinihabitans flavidus TaxID=569882 RepID=A0A1H8QV80_9RHOB|nr:phosphonate metabolism transcriptional regulator PhnF [Salinihabitans flavidus]SEO58200.1 GntR family transcriptional regulator, phosphonate transport system regulatory protein [Salinihabitans flavidus]
MSNSRPPLWKSISEWLTADIVAGHYGPGDKLPTEAALSARFAVNRHTVRRALSAMADEGLVLSRRGAGVFVAQTPTEYPIGARVRFHKNLRAAGRIPDKRILTIETRAADTSEAEALSLGAGASVHVYDGLSLADGQHIALFRSVFSADRFPAFPAHLRETQSVTEALIRQGVADYTRLWTRLTATRADAAQARHLRLSEGDPLLRSVAVNTDTEGVPVEYGRTWFAGDRVTLTIGET